MTDLSGFAQTGLRIMIDSTATYLSWIRRRGNNLPHDVLRSDDSQEAAVVKYQRAAATHLIHEASYLTHRVGR